MTSIWVESLSRSFDQALDLMAAAVRDCTDELWESGMWQVTAPGANEQAFLALAKRISIYPSRLCEREK